jgi:hypothetical protein
MGNRNPVTLVSTVVKRKNAVVTGNLFEANIPPTTISPLPIARRVIMTCKIVKAPTDMPRIMDVPVVARSLAEHHFDPNYSRNLRPAELGSGIIVHSDNAERLNGRFGSGTTISPTRFPQ